MTTSGNGGRRSEPGPALLNQLAFHAVRSASAMVVHFRRLGDEEMAIRAKELSEEMIRAAAEGHELLRHRKPLSVAQLEQLVGRLDALATALANRTQAN